MIFDTDILIWVQRGKQKAARLIDNTEDRIISVQTFMELMQCPSSKKQHQYVKDFLTGNDFRVLPLTENIGHRAAVYIEEYSLAMGLLVGDAIIAATATENNLILATSNKKHFQNIQDLRLHVFRP